MKKIKKIDIEGDDEDDWLLTYADAVTLLLAFFVLLLSTSMIDPNKFNIVVAGISESLLKKEATIEQVFEAKVNQQTDLIMHRMKREIDKYASANGVSDHLVAELQNDELLIINHDPYLFKPGQAELSRNSSFFLRKIHRMLHRLPYFLVFVEGHTDNTPVTGGAFRSNWELASSRANNIIHGLENLGTPGKQFVSVGYGENRPIASNKSVKGRALNRRVVFRIERSELLKGVEGFLKEQIKKKAPLPPKGSGKKAQQK